MSERANIGSWVDGLAEWTEGDTAFLSIAFSWKVDEAYSRAAWYRAAGYHVRAGGPGLFTDKAKARLGSIAELGGNAPDALRRHNPMATKASDGCPVGCYFCIVPAMSGREFTLYPDFEVRPVLTDNNLSVLREMRLIAYQTDGSRNPSAKVDMLGPRSSLRDRIARQDRQMATGK